MQCHLEKKKNEHQYVWMISYLIHLLTDQSLKLLSTYFFYITVAIVSMNDYPYLLTNLHLTALFTGTRLPSHMYRNRVAMTLVIKGNID